MHLLSTYLYSFPRGNFLNAALQKQSGENAVFIVQPDVKTHGCSPPAVLFPCRRAVLSPCLRISGRERDGLKLSALHLKSHDLFRPFCCVEAMICILADLAHWKKT